MYDNGTRWYIQNLNNPVSHRPIHQSYGHIHTYSYSYIIYFKLSKYILYIINGINCLSLYTINSTNHFSKNYIYCLLYINIQSSFFSLKRFAYEYTYQEKKKVLNSITYVYAKSCSRYSAAHTFDFHSNPRGRSLKHTLARDQTIITFLYSAAKVNHF